MTKRADLLGECIPQGMPLDVFKEAWCNRCLNPDCVRSAVGQSRFETRIKDWEEKLFKSPPVMALDDPLYVNIVGKKFITIDPGRMPEIRSAWVDPEDLAEPEPPLSVCPEPPLPPLAAPEAAPEPVAEPAPQAPALSPQKSSTFPRSTLALMGSNAPDQSGKVLPAPSGAPTTRADPWASPEPPDPSDVVVQPGARIKMGRSGV